MKTFRVWARSATDHYVDVEAVSTTEARAKADETDGSLWTTPDPYDGDWAIHRVELINPDVDWQGLWETSKAFYNDLREAKVAPDNTQSTLTNNQLDACLNWLDSIQVILQSMGAIAHERKD